MDELGWSRAASRYPGTTDSLSREFEKALENGVSYGYHRQPLDSGSTLSGRQGGNIGSPASRRQTAKTTPVEMMVRTQAEERGTPFALVSNRALSG